MIAVPLLLTCIITFLAITSTTSHPLQPPFDTIINGKFTTIQPSSQPTLQEQRRRLEDYSWGASKSYSYQHATATHTVGNQKVLVMKYKQAGQTCSNCDTVISDADLNHIIEAGKVYVHENSYGTASLFQVDIVPITLEITTNGGFYDDIDACREAAYVAGYDFTDYAYDLIWRASEGGSFNGGSGGSAIPGGRSQRFNYGGNGDRDTFASKIFPHEFTHNFGCGHAWQGPMEYGDNYDMVGGGIGHVSVAAKYRFKWINRNEVALSTKESATQSDKYVKHTYHIHAFDYPAAKTNLVTNAARLGKNVVLGVRFDSQYMQKKCPVGLYQWCPDWGSNNNRNTWIDGQYSDPSNHYVWISYRAHDGYVGSGEDSKLGASIHVVKRSNDGWISATSFVDVRETTTSQKDAFLKEGETYVFDGNSDTSIVIKTSKVDLVNKVITVEVTYIHGIYTKSHFETAKASWLCTATVSCGRKLNINLDMGSNGDSIASSRTDDKSIVIVKVGEKHDINGQLRICSDSTLQTKLTTYTYDKFPIGPLLHGSDLNIGATGIIPDLCDATATFPSVLTFQGTGIDWIDGVELLFVDTQYLYFGTDMKNVMREGSWPRYIGSRAGYSGNLHLAMVHCDIHYCKKNEYDQWSGASTMEGWQWSLAWTTDGEPDSGNNGYFGSVDTTHKAVTDPTKLKTNGIVFLKGKGGHLATETLSITSLTSPTTLSKTLGIHGNGIKWLILSRIKSDTTVVNTEIQFNQCNIQDCAEGYQMKLDAAANAIAPGCTKSCSKCPTGMTSLVGFSACFWDAPSLQVTIKDETSECKYASDKCKTGVYTKVLKKHLDNVPETHNDAPYYQCTSGSCAVHQGNGVVLRADRFNGWVLTVLDNMEDGSGYGGDLAITPQCNCATKTPFPQLWDASPCSGCDVNKRDGWTCGGCENKIVTIVEIGNPPASGETTNDDKCSCKDQSLSGSSVYCQATVSAPIGSCTWNGATGSNDPVDPEDPEDPEDPVDDTETETGSDDTSDNKDNKDSSKSSGSSKNNGNSDDSGSNSSTPSGARNRYNYAEKVTAYRRNAALGIVFGLLFLVAIIAAGVFFYVKQKRAKAKADPNAPAVATIDIEMTQGQSSPDMMSNPMRSKKGKKVVVVEIKSDTIVQTDTAPNLPSRPK